MASNDDNEGRLLISEDSNEDTKRKAPSLSQILNCLVLVLSILCFPVSTGCAQALGGIVPPFELNLWRYLAEFLMVAPLVVKRSLVLPEKRLVLPLLVVCVLSCAYNILFFTASTYLPLGIVTTGDSGLWLVFTGLVTLVVFRECKKYLIVAVISCLVGLFLLAQPEFIFPDSPTSVYNPVCKATHQPSNQTGCDLGLNESVAIVNSCNVSSTERPASPSLSNDVVGFLLMVGSAAAATLTSFVVNKALNNINSLTMNTWVSGLGIIASVILMAIFENPTVPTSTVCIILLLGQAVATSIMNLTWLAIQLVFSPSIVCIAFQMPCVISYVAQCTVMKSISPGKQNAAEIAGVVFVIFGNVIMACVELFTLCVAHPHEQK